MSADGHTVCPGCHPDELFNYTDERGEGIIDRAAEDFGFGRSVRENYEFYFLAEGGQIYLVVDYTADCWDCDWSFEHHNKVPIPPIILKENNS